MNTPHPDAALLRAIADGKQMQIEGPTAPWRDAKANEALWVITAGGSCRIKPELDVHQDAIAALDAEIEKPEGCLSNCDTCTYAWSSPANPGHCYWFYEEPQGVCQKHSEQNQRRSPTDAELVELVRDSKNCEGNRMLPVAFAREVEALVTGTRNCSRHPSAPHGPDGAGCKCHNWAPGDAS